MGDDRMSNSMNTSKKSIDSKLLIEALELLKVIPGQAGETVTIEYANRVGEFLGRAVLQRS
jgi:hypothetical protein